jgi:hypothetical protein
MMVLIIATNHHHAGVPCIAAPAYVSETAWDAGLTGVIIMAATITITIVTIDGSIATIAIMPKDYQHGR